MLFPFELINQNHDYIENGVLPIFQAKPSASSVKAPSRSIPRRGNCRQFDSPHFATISSARQLGKDELLYEAELEIVATRRSRSRSAFTGGSGWESEESGLILPGGWKGTPRKRKRRDRSPVIVSRAGSSQPRKYAGRLWGVKEWKRLEKVYQAERLAWVEKRDIRPLPAPSSPFLGWIRSGKLLEVEDWDAERVVSRFLNDEGVEGELSGEWDRYVSTFQKTHSLTRNRAIVMLRVDALERRAKKSKVDVETVEAERRPKKARTDSTDTSSSNGPPSTIRRMLGFVLSNFSAMIPSVNSSSGRLADAPVCEAVQPENKLLSKLRDAQAETVTPDTTAMKQVIKESVTAPTRLKSAPAHPEDSNWTALLPFLPSVPTSAPLTIAATPSVGPQLVPSLLARSRPTHLTANDPVSPMVPSSIPSNNGASLGSAMTALTSTDTLSHSASTPPTRSLYPPLYPPLTQRSSAIARLFPEDSPLSSTSTGKGTPPAPIAIPKRKTGRDSLSVRDLVRNFEDAGAPKGSMEKELV